MSSSIAPFKIAIPDSTLSSLKSKLAAATYPAEVEFSDSWDYGTPLSDIKRLASYWQNGFDWRAQEKRLNDTLPQFTTKVDIDGFGELEMHFVHKRSENADSIPLLFCHGWPGSFLEVIKILPLLTSSSSSGPTFHVVAPSLPNFGFSQGVTQRSFSRSKYAEAIHKVMLNLGYTKYVTQGGDWGFSVTRLLAANYPTHVLAHHINFIQCGPLERINTFLSGPLSAAEKAGVERTRWFAQTGYGYNLLQSTRPSTIGFALADSPVALLAWIYEKLHDWTDSYPWTDDEVLTWISIYAFSRAGPQASQRIYWEARNNEAAKSEDEKLYGYNKQVKLGLSYFPRDLQVPPSSYGRTLGEVVFEKRHEDGGHFAAYERPEKLVEDLKEMFSQGAKDVVGKL